MTMGILFNYILLSSIVMTLLYGVYRLFMAGTSFYRLNRVVLLSIYLLSWLLPLITTIDFPTYRSVEPEGGTEIGILQGSVIVSEEPVRDFYWLRWIIWIWLTGVILSTVKFGISILRLRRIILSGNCRRIDGIREVITSHAPGPFSWANIIVLRPGDLQHDADLIRAHERSHIRLRHWIDLIIGEFTLILQWFSPAAWLAIKSMKENHEYEVDRVVSPIDENRYKLMLIKMTAGSRFPVLTDSLNQSKIKKRLTMMKTKSASQRRLATLLIPGAAAIALLGISSPVMAHVSELLCATGALPASVELHIPDKGNINPSAMQLNAHTVASPTSNSTPIQGTTSSSLPAAGESTAQSAAVSNQSGDSKGDNETPAYFINGVKFNGDLNSISPNSISGITIIKDDPDYPQGKIMIRTKDEAENENKEIGTKNTVHPRGNDSKVYFTPEKIAEYKGGMPALMEDLRQNLRYPESVKELTRVIVQFVIEKDGTVGDMKVVRSGGEECDAEALKAVKATSGNWIPGEVEGKAVATQFTLPVNFKPEP